MPGSDVRVLLAKNLEDLNKDPTKIRNVALLVALMKEDNMNLDPFIGKIKK